VAPIHGGVFWFFPQQIRKMANDIVFTKGFSQKEDGGDVVGTKR
jgi:hypothetical protein